MDKKIPDKVERFFSRYPARSYSDGQIIIHAGDQPPGVHYLVSGQVRQYDINEQGNEIVVNVFKPGAFFPMNWAINRSPNAYFYAAAGEVRAKLAPADEVVGFLTASPDVTFDLLKRLYSGVDGILRRMAHLMGGSARTRLLYELIIAGRRFGKQQSDGNLLVSLHEDELAARSGMSRETVSRELAKLRTAGLLSVSRGGTKIKDLHKLETELGEGL